MDNKLFVWLQVIATVGVLGGLAVVIYELQQTRTLVQAQITQARLIELNNDQSSLYGEQGAEALAKACLRPHELTDSEKFVVDTVFWNIMRRAYSSKRLFNVSGLNPDWKFVLRLQLGMILTYPIGEKWLDQYQSSDAEINDAVRTLTPSLLQNMGSCADKFAVFD